MAAIGRKYADALALVLAGGLSVVRGAEQAGVSERTAYRLLADPAFRQRIQSLRAEMIEQALGRMANAMTDAAETLRELLKANADPVRLDAARSILDLGMKTRETVELEQRLVALELKANGNSEGKP